MVFTIITHVPHIKKGNKFFAYQPYIREMNIWEKYVSKIVIVAPLINSELTSIYSCYNHTNIEFIEIESFNLLTFKSFFKSFIIIPNNFFKIFKSFTKSDHIHLRCPGNVGLIGSICQIFFPKINKTVKYAGNWDNKSKQPLSYRFQKYILRTTFLTKKCKVLVYGEWKNNTKNIVSFFTASYFENDKIEIAPRKLNQKIRFIFVGTLTEGKKPFYALQVINNLVKRGLNCSLDYYGEGKELEKLKNFVIVNNLSNHVSFYNNQSQETIKVAYQCSNFIILPSKSEGWPKVVAEGMFWGCLPIASKVSCIPNMLDNGTRGILLDLDIVKDCQKIDDIISNESFYNEKVKNAILWSRTYTLDLFESKIKNFISS